MPSKRHTYRDPRTGRFARKPAHVRLAETLGSIANAAPLAVAPLLALATWVAFALA